MPLSVLAQFWQNLRLNNLKFSQDHVSEAKSKVRDEQKVLLFSTFILEIIAIMIQINCSDFIIFHH